MKALLKNRETPLFLIIFSVLIFIGLWMVPVSNSITRFAGVGAIFLFLCGIFMLACLFRYIRFLFSAFIIILFVFLALPGRAFDSSSLCNQYRLSLLSYKGTPYVWGGESRLGIDCSGLVRRAFIDATLRKGIHTLNPRLIRLSFRVWWKDASASDLSSGYNGLTRIVVRAESLNRLDHSMLHVGDLAVTANGIHVLAYIGRSRWIAADPNLHAVVIAKCPDLRNVWFGQRVKIIRWSVLSVLVSIKIEGHDTKKNGKIDSVQSIGEKMAKKSGYDHYSGIWGNSYYDNIFNEISDQQFSHNVFKPGPALRSRESKDGCIVEREFIGQEYDPKEWELIEGRWTHEHCRVCFFTISDGESYWENRDRFILCDVCYEHYVKKSR